MSELVAKCYHCHKEYIKEDELSVVSCDQYICPNCNPLIGTVGSCSTVPALNRVVNLTFPNELSRKKSKISTQTHIIEEISSDGTTNQYRCTSCGKAFKSRSQKYYHLQCIQPQSDDTLHECDVCKKTFVRFSQLKYHKASHASPVNECPKCQKTFSNPLALRKHQSLHKIKPKQCPYCDKTFLKKISFEQHVAGQHLKQLEYGCAYCNKSYASKSTLQLHLQSHEKKRYKCPYCEKYFQRNSILNIHLKRHNPYDAYECKICNKVFREPSALTRHRKIHEENTLQYYCTLCNKTILRKDNMNRHINSLHPNEHFTDLVTIIKPAAVIEHEKELNKTIKENMNIFSKKSSNNIKIIENRMLHHPNSSPNSNGVIVSKNLEVSTEEKEVETTTHLEDNPQIAINTSFLSHSKLLTIGGNLLLGTSASADAKNSDEIQKKLSNEKVIPNSIALHLKQCESEQVNLGHNKASVIRSIGNVKKMLNECPQKKATNIAKEKQKTLDFEYRHKKYNRHYNVGLYRKILGCDDEDYEDVSVEKKKHEQQNFYDAPNASTPVHWRKSFKKSYETSTL